MKKWKLISIAVLIILLLVPVACASPRTATSQGSIPVPTMAPAPPPAPMPAPALPPTSVVKKIPAADESVRGGTGTSANDGEIVSFWDTKRMIIRTGNISLVVEDIHAAIEKITRMAEDYTGYVVSSNVWEENLGYTYIPTPEVRDYSSESAWQRLAGNISIRIPAERFEDAMRGLRGLSVDVTSESTSSTDVTEEYTDLTAKLNNLEATEIQLLKLLEKAEKVEDILNVQRELSRTRGEIEQIKGRMQYLERTSAMSLIEVQLQQASLDVRFSADKTRAKKGEDIRFFSQIAGGFSPYSYEWDFGDGKTSTVNSPVHTYNAVGSYTVTVKISDDRGNTDFETRTDYITVLPGWNAGNTAGGAWNGLVTFGHALANIFIWIGIFSPVWIIIGGIVWWLLRRRKHKKLF
ncbi:DUF4349 domain-containing protein [Chloroflexota bacterium]